MVQLNGSRRPAENGHPVSGHKLGEQLANPLDILRKELESRVKKLTVAEGDETIRLSDVAKMDLTENERETFRLEVGDVVLVEASGSPKHVGKSAIWNGEVPECCFQNTVIRFRPHAVRAGYALIVFRHFMEAGLFAQASHGVGIQHLGASRFAELEVPIPGMEEQDRIVEETTRRLRAVADASNSLQSALRGIDEQITTTIEAAATGQLRLPQTSNAISDEDSPNNRPETTIEVLSPVAIPSSWAWSRICDVGEVQIGRQRSPKYEHGEHVVPYLRVANVFEDRIDTSDILKMNFSPEEQETFRLRIGDILLNEGQSAELVGRPAMYRGEPPDVCFQNTLVRFRPFANIHPAFALLVFRYYLRLGVFRAISRQSTNIAHLGMQRFSELPFPVPSRAEQDTLADLASRRIKELEEQRASVATTGGSITTMRQEILAAAVSGGLSNRVANEETASDMLKRLGCPPKQAKHPRAAVSRDIDSGESETATEYHSLNEVIKSNGGNMLAEDLFVNARYNRDKTRDVERFYLALRDELGTTLKLSAPEQKGSTIEVIPDET